VPPSTREGRRALGLAVRLPVHRKVLALDARQRGATTTPPEVRRDGLRPVELGGSAYRSASLNRGFVPR
jgi:hypothetical protein